MLNEQSAAIIWACGILGWLAIRWPHRRRARRQETVHDKRNLRERTLLGFTILGLVVIPAMQLATGWLDFANYPYWPVFGWTGLITMVGFLIVFYFSHRHLAKNWSVSLEIRQDHELVTSGIYRHIRHPMYSSFWLWGLSQFFLISNWIAGLSGLASVALLYFGRIRQEEQMMHDQFGADYREYCRHTNRLWPRLF